MVWGSHPERHFKDLKNQPLELQLQITDFSLQRAIFFIQVSILSEIINCKTAATARKMNYKDRLL